jgi:hypothetical protein
VRKLEVRESAVMMSSVGPSLEYSWSGSRLRFSKGKTATTGPVGRARRGSSSGLILLVGWERRLRRKRKPVKIIPASTAIPTTALMAAS